MRIYLDNCCYNRPYDAEKFLVMVKSDAFDYTEWQREHYDKIPDKELRQNMIEFCKAHPFKGKCDKGSTD